VGVVTLEGVTGNRGTEGLFESTLGVFEDDNVGFGAMFAALTGVLVGFAVVPPPRRLARGIPMVIIPRSTWTTPFVVPITPPRSCADTVLAKTNVATVKRGFIVCVRILDGTLSGLIRMKPQKVMQTAAP
jgi:hypothetical protein